MANLLTRERKTQLLWNKRVRVSVMVMLVSIIGFVIIAAALLPAALYSRVVLMSMQSRISQDEALQMTSFGKQRQEIIRELQVDKDLLAIVANMDVLLEPSVLLRKVDSLMSSISSVTTSLVTLQTSPEGDTYVLRVSGTALTRSDVVAVRDVFKGDTLFNIINFPLSNLTPQVDGYIFLIELEVSNLDKKKSHE